MHFKRRVRPGPLMKAGKSTVPKVPRTRPRMGRLTFNLSYYFLIAFWSSITIARALWEFLRHPSTFFYQKKRLVEPEFLKYNGFGTHKYVTANGIKFHCVTCGSEDKPLMLFLHGFPEFWFSWRYQLQEFSKDYYTVAVDLRGYGDTERPTSRKDYQMSTLIQDVAELIPALGYKSCVLVAHDWGGVLAWKLVQNFPDLVDQFIVMNCPHAKIYMKSFQSSWKQFLNTWFVFVFQLPYLPEIILRARDYKFLEELFTSETMGVKNKEVFPEEVMEAFKYVFSQPGALTAAINYYRNMFKIRDKPVSNSKSGKVEKPVLIIWGDDDQVLVKEMADKHDSVTLNLVVKHIPNCSHWVQQDRPDLVNHYMHEFLQEITDLEQPEE